MSRVFLGALCVAAFQAKLLKCDYIVMGRRGLGDVAGLLLGSVSHKVGQMTETTLITTQ